MTKQMTSEVLKHFDATEKNSPFSSKAGQMWMRYDAIDFVKTSDGFRLEYLWMGEVLFYNEFPDLSACDVIHITNVSGEMKISIEVGK